jgi:uncharacterized membrane protein
VALYGIVPLMAAVAYFLLTYTIISSHGNDSVLARAIGRDQKAKVSVVLHALAVPLAFLAPIVALAIDAGVAVMRLIADVRIERAMQDDG